ncbi:MAG: pre-16S rRNA-processing nuclease YqgF [Spirulina sp. SIO3F2]|nr:pre-16S rRNA-processing nuclease YqgF [Spirulina sp. SIO3F2]
MKDENTIEENDSLTQILGFDPGRDKCGIAVMTLPDTVLYHAVVATAEVERTIAELLQTYQPERVVLGNQTLSKQWRDRLREQCPQMIPITLVDERNSTLEARDRYWQMYPPRGLQRLIPQGMRLPPCPVDDIVAILLIERYCASCLT